MLTISSISSVHNVFCFFLSSLGGSLRALISRAEAESTTSLWACLFRMVSFIVILRSFQLPAAWATSLANIFGDRPRGPLLETRADMALTSPLVQLKYMTLTSLGLNFGSILEVTGVRWTWILDNQGKLNLSLLWAEIRKLASIFLKEDQTSFFVLKRVMK